MKQYLLITLLGLSFCACKTSSQLSQSSSSPLNTTINDRDGDPQLLGLSNRAGLQEAPFAEWFNTNYKNYELDKTIVKHAKNKTEDIQVKIFMGTWCGDSQREVPPFYKVMDALGMDEDQLTLINLNNTALAYKQSPQHEERGLNIHRVPTFIFYKNDQEIGRIVESPVTSLETDIAQIIQGIPTIENYRVVKAMNTLFEEKGLGYVQDSLASLAKQFEDEAEGVYELNTYGFVLKFAAEREKALAVFELNALLYPEESRPYRSLGRMHVEDGNKDKAISLYKKAIVFDPEDERAKKALEELEKESE